MVLRRRWGVLRLDGRRRDPGTRSVCHLFSRHRDINNLRTRSCAKKRLTVTRAHFYHGLLADVKAISELAHAHGAYVYADIIQAAGAVPIDVQAMGIDFAACSTYKWLMGLRGLAYLYVKKNLQGSVVRPTQFGVSRRAPPHTSRLPPQQRRL